MKKKYAIILAFLCAVLLSMQGNVHAQQKSLITIESVVVDEAGNPIENAEVFCNAAYAKTDASGKFMIEVEPGMQINIEAKRYEPVRLTIDEASSMTRIALVGQKFLYGSDDVVNLAFRKAYTGDVLGAVSRLNTTDMLEYDNTAWASDVLSGRMLGMLGGNNIRGMGININVAEITGSGLESGNALFVVDGLPRDISYLRTAEVEEITILRDVKASILYGSAAINGVILITTKRGQAFKKVSNFTLNTGISIPRELPKYLNSADYMTYYNKARENDGLSATFDEDRILNHRNGNKYRYPDVDYYSDEYMRPFKDYFDLMGEFSGGNDIAKYYANIGWVSAGSILDFGEAANARNNAFNVRGNVDLKINNWIKTAVDATSTFGSDRRQRGGFWTAAANTRPYEFTPLLPFDLIDPENPLLLARKNDVDGKYLLGGNASFVTNPIADAYAAGVVETIDRNFSFNNRVDFDLDKITEGLSFHTNVSFDYLTRYDQTVANEYSIYEPVWDENDKIVNLIQRGKDARPGTQSVGNSFFQRRFGFYGMLSYDRIFDDIHHFTGTLIGYGSNFKELGNFQGVKHAHLGFQGTYTYDQKYIFDLSGAYVNSVKLPEGNRGGFSPSLGLGWVLSEEDFMADWDKVDYLKLKLTGGILNSDFPIGNFFYYDNRYTTSGSLSWNEGARSRSGVMSSWSDNPNLDFAQRKEINLGVEGLFFNRTIGVEAHVFYNLYDGLVVRPSTIYPSFYSDFIPYENFGRDEYKGAELQLSFNKSVGDWNFYVAANGLYVTSERTKVDEVWSEDYLYRQGRPVDATFGLEAVGFFQDDNDIANSPLQSYGTVRPGDIKYKDQNNDGLIDANDQVYLRRWQAPLSGGLQLKVSYKSLTFYALGEGRSGSETFMEGNYYWVDGNKKYSEVVLDAWTPETKATATYPRLSSGTNSNNHQRSSFWLYNNDYFNIRKVQLTYAMPDMIANALLMKKLNVFIDGSDVYQFAKNRKIRDTRTGAEPYYRTFSIGLKANF
jgi:TonB-linked SusC/RagA family outer membrane protein